MPEQRSAVEDPGERAPRPRAGGPAAWIAVPVAIALIALVALASRSGSLATGQFGIDVAPAITTLEAIGYVGLLVGTIALLVGAALWRGRMRHLKAERLFATKRQTAPVPWWVNVLALATLIGMLAFEVVVIVAYIGELRRLADRAAAGASGDDPGATQAFGSLGNESAALTMALVVVVVLGIVLAAFLIRARLRDDREADSDLPDRQASTVAAVDLSLGALRGEPDPRRAVIAAYGAMEQSLSGSGYGRRRSEAPLEYLRRVLSVPRLAADEVRTLTNLFQHAKFSRHAVDEPMRSQAIDALERIRAAAHSGAPT